MATYSDMMPGPGNDGFKAAMHGLSGFLTGGSLVADGWLSEKVSIIPSQPSWSPLPWGERFLEPSDYGPESYAMSSPEQNGYSVEVNDIELATKDTPSVDAYAGKFIVRK